MMVNIVGGRTLLLLLLGQATARVRADNHSADQKIRDDENREEDDIGVWQDVWLLGWDDGWRNREGCRAGSRAAKRSDWSRRREGRRAWRWSGIWGVTRENAKGSTLSSLLGRAPEVVFGLLVEARENGRHIDRVRRVDRV